MTNKALQSLLERLNQNDTSSSLIYLRPLNANVYFAKIWIDKPQLTDSVTNSDGPSNFYLVKNNENIFVAIVFDMQKDLHWFVLPDYRGMGYLTMALRDRIIPHLFLSRDKQRITIKENEIGAENFKASEKVAVNLGFTAFEDGEYFLSSHQITFNDYNEGAETHLSQERISELKKQINYLARSLWAIQTEIEMNYGNTDYTDELKELVNQIRNQTWKLEDFFWSKNS
ncbi:GNAT family N-acetyltransferase [Chryseobacterium sp. GP-SGM7]|uniref:GNAT family N-acetyltransferase n=1 Tax=Chryseobacterium sp. GP-SGM7 TaxID=3411323 RepID=UPI003B962AE9